MWVCCQTQQPNSKWGQGTPLVRQTRNTFLPRAYPARHVGAPTPKTLRFVKPNVTGRPAFGLHPRHGANEDAPRTSAWESCGLSARGQGPLSARGPCARRPSALPPPDLCSGGPGPCLLGWALAYLRRAHRCQAAGEAPNQQLQVPHGACLPQGGPASSPRVFMGPAPAGSPHWPLPVEGPLPLLLPLPLRPGWPHSRWCAQSQETAAPVSRLGQGHAGACAHTLTHVCGCKGG